MNRGGIFFAVWMVTGACTGTTATEATASEAAQSEGKSVTIHDVSILFPLTAGSLDGLLSPKDLFPQQTYLSIQATLNSRVAVEGTMISDGRSLPNYEQLRLVSLRFDDCFKTQPDSACDAQMRLVFQPLVVYQPARSRTTSPAATAVRGDAVHLSYSFSSKEKFTQAMVSLLNMRNQSEVSQARSLGIHPILAKEGVNGPYRKSLTQLIFQISSRQAKLTRVALMAFQGNVLGSDCEQNLERAFSGYGWIFAVFTIDHGRPTLASIPNIGLSEQFFWGHVAHSPYTGGFGGSSCPLPGQPFSSLMGGLIPDKDPENIGALRKLIKAAEDPDVHSAATMDCASCHVAQPFLDRLNNNGVATKQTGMRAFGYIDVSEAQLIENGGVPYVAINQRTINETERVAVNVQKLISKR